MPLSIRLVDFDDDWQGLYINGELVDETHHFSAADLLHYLAEYGLDCARVERLDMDDADGEGLPLKFSDMKVSKSR